MLQGGEILMDEEKKDESPATQKTYAKDDIIFKEGEVSRELYILLQGEIGIYSGDTLLNTLSEPISYFGEISSLTDSPRSATARVLSESAFVMEIPHPEFLVTDQPEMGLKLAKFLAGRLLGMNEKLVGLKSLFEAYVSADRTSNKKKREILKEYGERYRDPAEGKPQT
jgi:CRP-like cAMP-binding protein